MANHKADPTKARQARQAKRRALKAGTVHELRDKIWSVIAQLEEAMTTSPDILDPPVLRAAGSLGVLSGVYLKCIEVGELERRLAAVEAASSPRASALVGKYHGGPSTQPRPLCASAEGTGSAGDLDDVH